MKKRKKVLSTLAIAMTLAVATPSTTKGAVELQTLDEVATSTDEYDAGIKNDNIGFYEIKEELIRCEDGTNIEEAVSTDVGAKNYDKYRNKFVYQKLSSTEKKFYDELEKIAKAYLTTNVDATKTYYDDVMNTNFILMDGVSYNGLSDKRAEEIAIIFTQQNPQYYFFDGYCICSVDTKKIYLCIYDEFANGKYRAECTMSLFDYVDVIVNRVKQQSGDYNRVKAAHDEICKLVDYTMYWLPYKNSAWSAFVIKESNTSGISKAFAIVANACGIETLCEASGSYTWNRTYVDGNWYFIDCTVDDLDKLTYNSNSFLLGKSTHSMLDGKVIIPDAVRVNYREWSAYSNLLPDCPFDYNPNNPRVGEVPPSDGLLEANIFVAKADKDSFLAGVTTNLDDNSNLEFCWYATADQGNSWILLKDWTQNDEWLSWTPPKYGEYDILVRVREKGKNNYLEANTAYGYHPYIKGICQMPYTGAGGGYLIGVESYDNPSQSFQYEMLVLDCSLLAQGKDAWTYSTGKCKVVSGNALWTVWQPQYGYYWTLFRVYDGSGRLLDEICYGFVNAY